MALAKNTVTDKSSSSLFSFDFPHSSSDYSCTTMNLIDIDLEKMFGSSSINDNQNNNNNQLFDERFLNDFIDHHDEQVKPPPGFENFHQTTMNNSSDTMNLSQLLSSTIVADVEQPPRGTIRSSSSSTSDDQSQRTNNSYSILTNSQIYSPKIPSQTSTSKHSLIHSSSLSSTNSNNSTSRMPNYLSTDNRISSSSSSSSIDDALNAKYPFSSLPTINRSSTIEFNPEQQALQDNLNFLASMTNNESNFISNPIQEYIDHLNEICYQGFDNLNSLIQEQKWVENFLNLPPTSKKSSHANHSSSSEVLIVCEYFIYKCKKYQPIASQIFEYLANEKVELRLKELIFVFQSWKQAIHHAEQIHREEEKKFLLVYHHPQTYHLNKSIIQLAFNRLYNAIRQLNKLTEKTRATYQHATLNVFQTISRQTPIQSAQFLSMQQDKSSFVQPLKNPPHIITP